MDRKEAKRLYKEAPVAAGVWMVRNLKDGRVLLGAAPNAPARLNRHRFALEIGGHDCPALQADWKALGPEAFAFEVPELLKRPEDDPWFDEKKALEALEKAWLERLRPWGPRGYHAEPTP